MKNGTGMQWITFFQLIIFESNNEVDNLGI